MNRKSYIKHRTLTALAIMLLGAFASCSENEHDTYVGEDAVYFSETNSSDSIQYSFATGLKSIDTVRINVRIIGEAKDYDRVISYDVMPQSTAKAGLNYEELSGEVVLPSGMVQTSIDVVVTDLDEKLENSTVSLLVRLKVNDEFTTGYRDRLLAKLNITRQLVRPAYWDMPLSLYYGSYSKAKHRLCIQLQGFDFPTKFDDSMIGTYISFGRKVYSSLLSKPLWDEETQKYITADWDPI